MLCLICIIAVSLFCVFAFILFEWPYRLVLMISGYDAITHPWKLKTIWRTRKPILSLLAHENRHIEQVLRLGAWRFTVLYLYYNIRYGYYDNPFEIEARKAELE